MGLFSKAKDMQKQAQEAMGNMGGAQGGMGGVPGMGGMDMAAMAAYSQKINKINQTGIEAPAVIRSIQAVGAPEIGGGIRHHIAVTIVPDGGSPYDATIEQSMVSAQLETLSVGAAATVKYDPDNPSAAMLTSW